MADHLILTVPQPSYLVAAGILSAVLGQRPPSRAANWKYRPAPIKVVTPLGEMGAALREWHQSDAATRPTLWVLCFEEGELRQIAHGRHDTSLPRPSQAALKRILTDLTSAGMEVVVGPEHQGAAIEAVIDRIRSEPDRFSSFDLLTGMAQSSEHRFDRIKLFINRALMVDRVSEHDPAAGEYDGALTTWLQRRILPLCLPQVAVNALRDTLLNRKLFKQAEEHFIGYDCDILGSFDDLARCFAMRSAEVFWAIKIRGGSRTAQMMRQDAAKAVKQLKNGKPLLVIGHDMAEARRLLRYAIEQAGSGVTGKWEGHLPEGANAFLVKPDDEIAAYEASRNAGRGGPMIWEIPPLDERVGDIPLMAAVMLSKIHSEGEIPGSPGGFARELQQLAWLGTRHWPGGSAQLQRYLKFRMAKRRTVWRLDASIPPHPGIPHPGEALITAETARMQMLRWALGVHRQRDEALISLGLSTKDMPTHYCDTGKGDLPKGLPRRLLWKSSGTTQDTSTPVDRWA